MKPIVFSLPRSRVCPELRRLFWIWHHLEPGGWVQRQRFSHFRMGQGAAPPSPESSWAGRRWEKQRTDGEMRRERDSWAGRRDVELGKPQVMCWPFLQPPHLGTVALPTPPPPAIVLWEGRKLQIGGGKPSRAVPLDSWKWLSISSFTLSGVSSSSSVSLTLLINGGGGWQGSWPLRKQTTNNKIRRKPRWF